MKPFIKWIAISSILFLFSCVLYHFYLVKYPEKILVAIDTSFNMQSDLQKIFDQIKSLNSQRYKRYALVTDKRKIHTWADNLKPDKLNAYAPRNFDKLTNKSIFPEIEEASHKMLITNAAEDEISKLSGWEIIHLK